MESERYQAQSVISFCNVHPEEENDVYCFTCKCSICFDCTKSTHAGHEFERKSKISRQFRQEIPSILNQKEALLSKYEIELDNLKRMESSDTRKLQNTINRINKQKDEMCREIQKMTDEVISTATHQTELQLKIIRESITKLTAQKQEIEEVFGYLQKDSTTLGNDSLLRLKIEYESKISQPIDVKYPNTTEATDLHYVEGEISQDSLRSTLGMLIQNAPSQVDVREEAIFDHGKDIINGIVPIAKDLSWVLPIGTRKISLVTKNGIQKRVKETQEDCHRFDITGDGQMYYTTFDKMMVKKVDELGTESVVLDTKPLKPSGISIALNGNLLITLADEFNYDQSSTRTRIVQLFSTNGEIIRKYKCDGKDSSSMFTYPRRAVQNYNGDICVVDATGDFTGRLCVLEVDGRIKTIYTGRKKMEKFIPQDVKCDYTCNIIVNDLNNHAIHLLNPSGQFIKYLFKGEKVLKNPKSIGFYKSSLWVGSCTGRMKVFKYTFM